MNKDAVVPLAQGTPRTTALHAKYLCEGQFTPDMPELGKKVYWDCIKELVAAEAENAALSAQVVELQQALQPFANYACDPPCECHNCKARTLVHSSVTRASVPPSVSDGGTQDQAMYDKVLALLGMQEEGDPIAEIERLQDGLADASRFAWLCKHGDTSDWEVVGYQSDKRKTIDEMMIEHATNYN